MQYEKASERWSPVQGVRSVLMSVLSMLSEPNGESPANVEVSVCFVFEEDTRCTMSCDGGRDKEGEEG